MIHRRVEGTIIRQGINWNKDIDTFLSVQLRIWVFIFGFRIRSKKLMQESEGSLKKFYWYFNICGYAAGRSVVENFEDRTVNICGKKVSFELLEEIFEEWAARHKQSLI